MSAILDIGALILSGGNSSRMGFPKASLPLNGITLCENLLSAYLAAGVTKPVLVLNTQLYDTRWCYLPDGIKKQVLLVKNDFPERGRTYSLKIGLKRLPAKGGCFIHNIDNPGLNATLIHSMTQALKPEVFVVPVYQGQNGHPVLIGATLVNAFQQLQSANWILRDELKKYEKITVDAGQTNVLFNLNTPQDWSNFLHAQNKLITV